MTRAEHVYKLPARPVGVGYYGPIRAHFLLSLPIRSSREKDLVTLGLGCGPKGTLRLMCIERA